MACFQHLFFDLAVLLLFMKEDTQSVKQLIIAIAEKCQDALPELNLLLKHFDKLKQSQAPKLKKKDCLNPTFLSRLSDCGENIRLILTDALSRDFPKKQKLERQYNEYMQVIYDIRKYHEEAHLAHDMHKYSTNQKNTLLEQLKQETKRREELQTQLEFIVAEYRKQLQERDKIIRELEQRGDKDEMDNISQISKISKKGPSHGQLYGGESKVGKIETDYELTVETARLRKRILQLEAEQQQLERLHREEMESQKVQILQLQSKFEELMRSSSMEKESSKNGRQQWVLQQEQLMRMLLMQASSIEQYINEQE